MSAGADQLPGSQAGSDCRRLWRTTACNCMRPVENCGGNARYRNTLLAKADNSFSVNTSPQRLVLPVAIVHPCAGMENSAEPCLTWWRGWSDVRSGRPPSN